MLLCLNDTATTEIYTLSLHDALPIYAEATGWAMDREDALSQEDATPKSVRRMVRRLASELQEAPSSAGGLVVCTHRPGDRESTRLNPSHPNLPYSVFCFENNNTPDPS